MSTITAGTKRVESTLDQVPRASSPQGDMQWITPRRRNGSLLTLAPPFEQYIRLHCRSTGKREVVRATFDAKVTHSFIAPRIIRRLGFEIQSNLTVGCGPIPPTSSFVDLACDTGAGNACDTYRLYIDKGCPSDVVIGFNLQSYSS